MSSIRIEGGKPLYGQVYIQGSKNAALPMMAAAVLHKGITVLKHCPRITDVICMQKILHRLGAVTVWEGHTLIIDCRSIRDYRVPRNEACSIRSSISLMGSLLGRMGEVVIPYPGGCTIGRRPIDLHIKVLQKMGAKIWEEDGMLHAVCNKMKETEYTFPKSSVGATENALLAAASGNEWIVLHNCAREPEIIHLCNFLRTMGVMVQGIGTGTIAIKGMESFRDCSYTVPADRIAAGTYLYAGAATRGQVTLLGAPVEELTSILGVYKKMGGQYKGNSGTLETDSRQIRYPIPYLETAAYPGFPTDMQSVLMSVLATVDGCSILREQIFEERFKIVSLLNRMGAKILTDGRDALIYGGTLLKGTRVFAEELRGGAALAVAGLAAEGTTVIDNYCFIQRGYEDFCGNLATLGGRISVEEE